MDTNLTGLHKDTTLISIGLVSDVGETFYAELNDYDESQIDEWLKENVIHNLLYQPPLKGKEEYWTWDNNLNVRMRGNKQEVSRYLADWFQAILGGPVSWVNYGNGNLSPARIDKPWIEIWGYCPCYDWVVFNDLWGSVGMTAPRCLYHVPFDISSYLMVNETNLNINRDKLLTIYEKGKTKNTLEGAKGIRECYLRLKEVLQK